MTNHKLFAILVPIVLSLACNFSAPAPTVLPVVTGSPLGNPTEADLSVQDAEANTSFFAVHIETQDHSTQSASVAQEWPTLVEMVTAFDARRHYLTLEFQPQWAEYALQNPEALTQIRAWETAGHEIAFHHHGLDHMAWDGYTNKPGHTKDPKYRGTMDDAFALVSQLPANGVIYTAGMTDEDTDWPNGVIYATGAAGFGGAKLLGFPETATYNEVIVTQIPYKGYSLNPNQPQLNIAEIERAVQNMEEGQSLGLVTHQFNFVQNRQAFDRLFDLFESYDIQLKTVKRILD